MSLTCAVPRILHRIWPGEDPVPYRFRSHAATWADHHPGWEHRLWTPSELDRLDMVNRDLYDAAEAKAPDDWLRWRADVARLEVLYRHGGVYVDTDAECLKPLDPLLDQPCWFAESPNAPGHATQAVCASKPGHPFIGRLLEALPQSAEQHRGKRINHRVGSRFVDREYQDWTGGDVEMLPWRWFAGQSIKDRDRGATPDLSEAFCWHKYDNSARSRTTRQIAAYRAAADILDGADVTWWLTSGVLLGHIRDGAFIPWDSDVDLGIWPDAVDRAREAFADAGWPFKRNRDSQMWPVHDGVKIDLHTHYRDGDTVFKLHGKQQRIRMDYPARLFDSLRPTIFYLRRTLMPDPPEDYLEAQYGPDWLTPRRDWKWDRSPHNIVRL